jgi:hypothetical protein
MFASFLPVYVLTSWTSIDLIIQLLLTRQSKFFYPANLPIMSLLETLHRKKQDTKPQLKVFYWAFALIFVWEVVPEYMMPILTAVNVFCLAKRNSSGWQFSILHSLGSANTWQWSSPIFLEVETATRASDSCLCASISSISAAVLYICP